MLVVFLMRYQRLEVTVSVPRSLVQSEEKNSQAPRCSEEKPSK